MLLVSCGSLLNIGQDNNDARTTYNPVPSQNQLDLNDCQHEPTKGSERDSAMLFEEAPMGSTKLNIATEPEQCMYDQMCSLPILLVPSSLSPTTILYVSSVCLCSPFSSLQPFLPPSHCQLLSVPQNLISFLSSHLYLYSAFNNTNCNKALHNIKIGKLCQ